MGKNFPYLILDDPQQFYAARKVAPILKDRVLEFLHGSAPNRFCFRCLARAYPEIGAAADMRELVQVLVMRGEKIEVVQAACDVCGEHTSVVGTTRG
jgi:hypothetical protein